MANPVAPAPVFRYFSSVEGRATPRYGTSNFIGATRSNAGFVFNTEMVVAIPEAECAKYPKEYRNAVQRGDVLERKQSEHEAYQAARAAKSKKAGEDAKKQREAAEAVAKKSADAESKVTKSKDADANRAG